MSVLIKGMKMPENCAKCICSDDNARFCTVAHEYIPMLGKPAFCPLVELPEKHGRLIDADEITFPALATTEDEYLMENAIEEAPTVIEAEE